MLTTHGRAGRGGAPWLHTALAASGLILAVADGRPATACHIKHHETTSADHETSTTPTETVEQKLQQSFQKLLAAMPPQTPPTTAPTTPTLTPTASTTPGSSAPVALPQILMPAPATSSPTDVSTWHQTTPTNVMPPMPTSSCDNSSTTGSQTMMPPPMSPPGSLLTPPTPAPEPSTLLIVGVLAGAFAWRRRKSK